MKELLKTHQEWLLAAVAFLLLGMIAAIFFWSISGLAIDFGKAIGSGVEKNPKSNFDLEGAKQLNLKGLAQ